MEFFDHLRGQRLVIHIPQGIRWMPAGSLHGMGIFKRGVTPFQHGVLLSQRVESSPEREIDALLLYEKLNLCGVLVSGAWKLVIYVVACGLRLIIATCSV